MSKKLLLALYLINAIYCLNNPMSVGANLNQGSRADRIEKYIKIVTTMKLWEQDWRLYRGHWYKFFRTELNWKDAENFCSEWGGHLVSIKDKHENDFVHSIRNNFNIWLGLNKLNSTNEIYEWSDGTKVNYLNWDSTQPNEPNVHCSYMAFDNEKRGKWFDYGCHNNLPHFFVCKMKLS